MAEAEREFPFPRRRVIRAVLKQVILGIFPALCDIEIIGRENLPTKGPLLVVANHFSFLDPVAVIRAAPWPLDWVGGLRMPNAPSYVTWLPKIWGYYPVRRGGNSRFALRAAEAVLDQDGILGIMPEGGNWAGVLRPARPGTAFLAARCGAPVLPIGLDGLPDVFPKLRRGKRAKVSIRIGRSFGPFNVSGRGRERRRQLDEIGHTVMRKIADLIPPELRGYYSEDPKIRQAAAGTEIYPWDDDPEF